MSLGSSNKTAAPGAGLVRMLKRLPFLERRVVFEDLARMAPEHRRSRSPVVQFYSPDNNIGNFTPVLGIREMLGFTPDTWSIHDRNADFDFINHHYRFGIIGGAGLLHECFEPFWAACADKCRIPLIIWGVGVCLPDNKPAGVSREVVARVAARCELINVRDELTRDHYDLTRADVSACPTLVYLQKFRKFVRPVPGSRLFASHTSLVSGDEAAMLEKVVRASTSRYQYTDNVQRRRFGVTDIIRKRYCPTELVVATRLHGAIIAHGLGIPYIAVARDSKVRDFVRLYRNGLCVETPEELCKALQAPLPDVSDQSAIDSVLAFGRQVSNWAAGILDHHHPRSQAPAAA